MPGTFLTYLRQTQPVGTVGALTHTFFWFTASNAIDKVYSNPNFDPSKLKEGEKEVAIYCVHGTADWPCALDKVARRLIAKGLDPKISSVHLIAFEKRYQGKDIEFFAKHLIERIKENGHERVILVGHSRGGIINAFANEYFASKFNIDVGLIVNICAPFDGSYLANKLTSLLSNSIAQMSNGCSFLKDLNEKIAQSEIPYYFVAAQQDSIVDPLSTFNLEYVKKKPDSFTIYDRHGHLSILSSHRLVDKIYNLLTPLDSLFNQKIEDLEKKLDIADKDFSKEKYIEPGCKSKEVEENQEQSAEYRLSI